MEIYRVILVLFYHVAYCSSVLFDKESGVLKFLRDSATLEEVFIRSA